MLAKHKTKTSVISDYMKQKLDELHTLRKGILTQASELTQQEEELEALELMKSKGGDEEVKTKILTEEQFQKRREECIKGINELNLIDIVEMRSYVKPPALLVAIFKVFFILTPFGDRSKNVDWSVIRQSMSNAGEIVRNTITYLGEQLIYPTSSATFIKRQKLQLARRVIEENKENVTLEKAGKIANKAG